MYDVVIAYPKMKVGVATRGGRVSGIRYLPLSDEPNLRPTRIVNYLLAGPSDALQSAVVPLEKPIESCTSQATCLPRDSASRTESIVSKGVLVCT